MKTPLSGEDASNGIDGARILIGPMLDIPILVKDWQNLLMLGIPQKSKGCFTRPFSSRLFQEPCITLPFEYYETPFGNIPVDVSTIKELLDEQCKHGPVFKYMSEEIDEEEHSF